MFGFFIIEIMIILWLLDFLFGVLLFCYIFIVVLFGFFNFSLFCFVLLRGAILFEIFSVAQYLCLQLYWGYLHQDPNRGALGGFGGWKFPLHLHRFFN